MDNSKIFGLITECIGVLSSKIVSTREEVGLCGVEKGIQFAARLV